MGSHAAIHRAPLHFFLCLPSLGLKVVNPDSGRLFLPETNSLSLSSHQLPKVSSVGLRSHENFYFSN